MRRLLRDNGLSFVMFGLFFAFLSGHAITGYLVDCNERFEHGELTQRFADYLTSAHFAESVFENWESEFLQMGSYVVLTAVLYQRGSAESRPLPDETNAEDGADTPSRESHYTWLYQHSLSLALFGLFAASWGLHAMSGVRAYNADELRHGGATLSLGEYMVSSQFWFESFQNWQSEYLSVAVLIVLSIFLRERGSPESKAVSAPNSQTG